MIKCRISSWQKESADLSDQKKLMRHGSVATHVSGPLEAASVQPVWFLYGLKRYTGQLRLIIPKFKKKITWLLIKRMKWRKRKKKQNQKRTYHVHTQNKTTVSGTSGKVEYYNNTCYIVILSHPP